MGTQSVIRRPNNRSQEHGLSEIEASGTEIVFWSRKQILRVIDYMTSGKVNRIIGMRPDRG